MIEQTIAAFDRVDVLIKKYIEQVVDLAGCKYSYNDLRVRGRSFKWYGTSVADLKHHLRMDVIIHDAALEGIEIIVKRDNRSGSSKVVIRLRKSV